ncbi:MAG: glycine--tRNA ligase subunit beta [Pseudomonadota bacterium]
MKRLLIEIGAEEIPAGYIIPALEAFRETLLTTLSKARVDCGKAEYYGTPRRLALMVQDVPEMQRAETTTVMGPPERVGFGADGKPTLAAEKFAEKAGVSLDRIQVVDTDKGRYLSAVKEEACLPTGTLLQNVLPQVILSIPFPKSMRWGDLAISFARPIISVTALLGNQILDFQVGNIRSSAMVFGHHFMHPGPVALESAEAYADTLKSVGIIADIDERRDLLEKKILQAAETSGSVLLEDKALVDIVTNLVEYPYPVVGRFDEEFLELPDEVLITAMREHQKYFALRDEQGRLKPMFIAVNNTRARDMTVVARGHEKVIRARLSDAKFFYRGDLESTLDQFAEKLKSVTFQASLGTMYAKRERLVVLTGYLAQSVETGDKVILAADAARAAQICKADLVSQMVIEFTNLQGIMGRVYAQKAGETPEVASAIEQHYRPVHSGGKLPDTLTGKILAIADKIDTICGCFSADLIPTGASDPYALRRQGIGILQILMDSGLTLSLSVLVDRGVGLYEADPSKQKMISAKVMEFLRGRLANLLIDQGVSREAVNSALAVSFDVVPDDLLRIKALDRLRQEPDFEPLSVAFKRVVNILKKVDSSHLASVEEALFESAAEAQLLKSCRDVSARVREFTGQGDYELALKEIATLRPDVDRFFDDVMVMAEDQAVRGNRLALLASVSSLFSNLADFSLI